MDCYDRLIPLLTCAIRGEPGQDILPDTISDEEIKELYDLAKKHDLAHLIGVALEMAEPQVKKRYKPFFEESVKAMYRYEWLKGEQERIYALLEKHSIPYIPLKGTVIRELYREAWHRTSCDIDILIPEERLEESLSAFEEELTYTCGKHSRHDVSLTAPNGVHLELHYDIDEVYVDRTEFWADACLTDPDSYRYTFNKS